MSLLWILSFQHFSHRALGTSGSWPIRLNSEGSTFVKVETFFLLHIAKIPIYMNGPEQGSISMAAQTSSWHTDICHAGKFVLGQQLSEQ